LSMLGNCKKVWCCAVQTGCKLDRDV
jgi:hypothetical protein